jgi:hypothetical protein
VSSYWKAKRAEVEGSRALESTSGEKTKVDTEYTTKMTVYTKEMEEEELEKRVTLQELEASKKCITAAKEAA